MKHFVYYLVWGLVVLIVWGNQNSVATPPPPLPQPAEINMQILGQPKLGQTFDVIVEVSNAPSDISGRIYLYLSDGLELVRDASRDMTLSPGSTQSRRFTVKLVSGEKHVIRASFSEDIESGSRKYSAARVEKYIDLTSPTPVRDEVEYGFFSNDQVKIDTTTGYPTKRLSFVPPGARKKDGVFQKSASTVTIEGRAWYRLKDSYDSSLVPMPNTKVRLNNYVIMTPDGPYPNPFIYDEMFTYTDANGYFTFTGWQWAHTEITVLSENAAVHLDIVGYADEFPENYQFENYNMDNLYPVIWIETSEGAHIIRNMLKTRNWASSKLGYTVGQIDAEYYPGGDGTAYFTTNGPKIVRYQYWGTDEIWDARGRVVDAHEYGHYLMYRAYDDDLPEGDGPSPHYYWSVSSPGFAWKEGWAEFVGAAVWLTTSENELASFGWSGPYMYFEKITDQPHDGWYKGEDGTNTNGVVVEGAVATALWDIYDSRPIEDDSEGKDDDEIETYIPTLWNLVRTARLWNLLGQQVHVQNIYDIYSIWNDVLPAGYLGIAIPYPVDENIDVLYDRGLFGYVPSPQPPIDIHTNDCGGGNGPEITVTWSPNAPDVSYNKIYAVLNGLDTTFLGTFHRSEYTYTIYDAEPYGLYNFVAEPTWGDFVGDIKSSDTTLPSGFPPAAPSNLTAEREANSCWWNISWDDNSNNEDWFWVRIMCQGIQDHLYADRDATSVSYYNDTWDENILILLFAIDTFNCGICDFQDPDGCLLFSDPPVSTVVFNDGDCQAYLCPFLHVWDGEQYRPENNLLAKSMSSTSPDRDYVEHHYLTVSPVESNGTYDFKIIEANNDLTSLDYVELYYVDHDPSEKIVVDSAGNCYVEIGRITPARVVDHLGNDITPLVVQEDAMSYVSGGPGHLIIDFEGLPITGLQSADGSLTDCPGCGGGSHIWVPKQELPVFAKTALGGNNSRVANHLDVFVLDDNGDWQFVESVYGATNPTRSYVPLERFIKKDGSLTLKYQWNLAYRADEIAFSTTEALTEPLYLLHPLEANHSVSGDIRPLMDSSDNRYAILKQGDTISFSFNAPAQHDGKEREFVLEVEGRYTTYYVQKMPHADVASGAGMPLTFALHQNHPNPFNPTTIIQYALPKQSHVNITIYNILGQKVVTLVDKAQSAGQYQIVWDSKNSQEKTVASGVYLYRIEAGDFMASKKMLLLK